MADDDAGTRTGDAEGTGGAGDAGTAGGTGEDQPFDLLVVGGGINGAGIARDAALRGLSVLLVEKEDWGWGTSSKSSMLAHGGLRYLEQFELGLVHEALQDRELMLRQAPHLVRPLRFVYPLYPHVASRRTVRAGLALYDVLSHGKSVPGRRYLDRAACLAAVPGLNPDGLQGGATYYDAQVRSVERFVAELVWDARREGADCRNHTEVTRLLVEDGRCVGAVLRDPDGREETVRARAVVNAAGPWVDEVLARGVAERHGPLIRKTKGVHLVVPRFLDDAMIVRAASDGRTFFFLPWKEHTLVGTTDTDYEGDPGAAHADAEDVAYLLDAARSYFPDAPVDDVRYTYAGVRPLVHEEGLTASNVTRKHVLHDHARDDAEGLWSVQGGKITTYRHLAEEAVTTVCRSLGLRTEARMRPTREGTLPGGPDGSWPQFRSAALGEARAEGLHPDVAAHLVDTYGARWRAVLDATPDGEMRRRVDPDHPHLWTEIWYAVHEEDARTVADVMLRRTDLGLAADGNPRVARVVARRMAQWLGWDRERLRAERERYERERGVFEVPTPSRGRGRPTPHP